MDSQTTVALAHPGPVPSGQVVPKKALVEH